MSDSRIRYRFELPDGSKTHIELTFDPVSFRLRNPPPTDPPFWTELNFNQCANCPLSLEEHTHCPAALSLAPAIEALKGLVSFDGVKVTVLEGGRTIRVESTAQQALSSVMGLIMATSGCPWTDKLRPMARFHLPFASESETLYRSVSMFLMARALDERAGRPPRGMEALKQLYENLHVVNRDVSRRLGAATRTDPARNAIALLDSFTVLMPVAIEQMFEEITPLFDAWNTDKSSDLT